jgi:hypothetical protein
VSKQLIALAFAGALTVGLIAGCGSSGGETSTSSAPALTKAAFLKQADAVCAKNVERIESSFAVFEKKHGGFEKASSVDAMAEFSDATIIPALKSEAEKLRALGAPSGDEDKINEILDTFEEGIEEREAKLEDPSIDVVAVHKADEMANKYGLKVCVVS